MKMELKYKPELATLTYELRMPLEDPYLDIKDKPVLVSTNGRIISIIPVEVEEGDVPGHVPKEAIVAARKFGRRIGFSLLSLGEKATNFILGASYERRDKGKFPEWRNAVPADDRKEVRISFNADLLLRLTRAIGANRDIVILGIRKFDEGGIDPTAPIRVTSENNNGKGVLMPCRLGDMKSEEKPK